MITMDNLQLPTLSVDSFCGLIRILRLDFALVWLNLTIISNKYTKLRRESLFYTKILSTLSHRCLALSLSFCSREQLILKVILLQVTLSMPNDLGRTQVSPPRAGPLSLSFSVSLSRQNSPLDLITLYPNKHAQCFCYTILRSD